RYTGPEPWPYSRRAPDLPLAAIDDELLRVGVWGERRLAVDPSLDVQVGLRVEGGSRTASGSVEVQPRVTTRLRLGPDVTMSLGAGRYVQHAQSPAPVGPLLERALETGRLWLLAGPRRAPLDTRIVSLGGEAWLGEAWLASATAYVRDSRGVLLPDPTPGFLIQRSPLVEGRVGARGLDLSLRRLAGRVTGSVAYSLADAEAEAVGLAFPAPSDRRHVLDVTGRVRLSSDWNLGLAYTYATGSPYARTLERTLGESEREAAFLVDPFRRRTPPYASLDLVLDYARRIGVWSVGGFLQARNLTGHDNDVTYTHTTERCPGAYLMDGTCVEGTPVPTDNFTPGIPTIPLLGLRISYRGG
ncbi:MAG: TonB-dependent receptor, partial [Gemmatimonadota bacterium]